MHSYNVTDKFSLNWNRWLKQNPILYITFLTEQCVFSLRKILQNLPFVMSQSCEMQGCQWYGIKRTKLHSRE